jgi:hypothetical protein
LQDTNKWTLLHQMQTLWILPILHNYRHPKYYSKKERQINGTYKSSKSSELSNTQEQWTQKYFHIFPVTTSKSHTPTLSLPPPHCLSLSWNSRKSFLILRLVVIVVVNFYEVFSHNSCFPSRYFGRRQACISLVRFSITAEARKVE